MAHYSKISLLITLCIFFVLCMSGCSSSGSSSSGGAQTDANVIPVQEVKITGVKEIAIGNSALFKAEVVPSGYI